MAYGSDKKMTSKMKIYEQLTPLESRFIPLTGLCRIVAPSMLSSSSERLVASAVTLGVVDLDPVSTISACGIVLVFEAPVTACKVGLVFGAVTACEVGLVFGAVTACKVGLVFDAVMACEVGLVFDAVMTCELGFEPVSTILAEAGLDFRPISFPA